jgi:transcriptional regulator with XRE-family HTH domain
MSFSTDSKLDARKLGSRIRQARERKGLSQEEFARLISRNQRAISEYENGKRKIAVTELPIFAQALDVSLLYFIEDEVSPDELDKLLLQEFHRLPTLVVKHTAIKLLQVLSELPHN